MPAAAIDRSLSSVASRYALSLLLEPLDLFLHELGQHRRIGTGHDRAIALANRGQDISQVQRQAALVVVPGAIGLQDLLQLGPSFQQPERPLLAPRQCPGHARDLTQFQDQGIHINLAVIVPAEHSAVHASLHVNGFHLLIPLELSGEPAHLDDLVELEARGGAVPLHEHGGVPGGLGGEIGRQQDLGHAAVADGVPPRAFALPLAFRRPVIRVRSPLAVTDRSLRRIGLERRRWDRRRYILRLPSWQSPPLVHSEYIRTTGPLSATASRVKIK